MLKLFALLCALCLLACNDPAGNAAVTDVDTVGKTVNGAPPPALKVSAHLIYEDGTLSSFDVLNNDTIALWNTIIGEGSAEKPSENTKISLAGDLQNVNLLIKSGKRSIDTTVSTGKQFDYVLKSTGCSEVYVTVRKDKKVLYNDTIPFQCGE